MVMSRTELKPWQNGIAILEKVQKWVYFLENTLFSSGVVTKNKTQELGLLIVLLDL